MFMRFAVSHVVILVATPQEIGAKMIVSGSCLSDLLLDVSVYSALPVEAIFQELRRKRT